MPPPLPRASGHAGSKTSAHTPGLVTPAQELPGPVIRVVTPVLRDVDAVTQYGIRPLPANTPRQSWSDEQGVQLAKDPFPQSVESAARDKHQSAAGHRWAQVGGELPRFFFFFLAAACSTPRAWGSATSTPPLSPASSPRRERPATTDRSSASNRVPSMSASFSSAGAGPRPLRAASAPAGDTRAPPASILADAGRPAYGYFW